MNLLDLVLQWFIYLSVFTTGIVVYLNVNKLWSRKHEPVVADSISVAAQLISFVTIVPFLINYGFKGSYWDAGYQFLYIVYTVFLILTGIGFWVTENRYIGIWQKLSKSLVKESNEVGNLVKALGSSASQKQLLEILHRLAWLDDNLDEKERKYIETFIEQLQIESEGILENKPPEEGIEKFNRLRQLVQEYLAIKPPMEEVKLLSDLVQALIGADEQITPEEELIASEINGMVDEYANQKAATAYAIAIHPKNPEQAQAILAAIPEAKEESLLGDRAFVAGSFKTRRYAEVISESYRDRGWFTVVYENLTHQHEPN